MEKGYFELTQEDGYKTKVFPCFTKNEPKGSVVILHGMAEHHERYQGFADFLNANGFDVFMYDHRGHGLDNTLDDVGFFAEQDGYLKVVNDAIEVLKYAKENNRGEKLIMFGHSMGSIIARNVMTKYTEYDKAVICGTANPKPPLPKLGLMLGSLVATFKGNRYRTAFMNSMCINLKGFEKISDRTAFDWLTRDNTIVGRYINDPYCGYLCTAAFYRDMMHFCDIATSAKKLRNVRTDLPILIISGAVDPVGGYGKDVARLYDQYQNFGFRNVECIIYEDCRHELLNELNKADVMNDILKFIV